MKNKKRQKEVKTEESNKKFKGTVQSITPKCSMFNVSSLKTSYGHSTFQEYDQRWTGVREQWSLSASVRFLEPKDIEQGLQDQGVQAVLV